MGPANADHMTHSATRTTLVDKRNDQDRNTLIYRGERWRNIMEMTEAAAFLALCLVIFGIAALNVWWRRRHRAETPAEHR
jgi:sensor c-di-GMP phosphodiesterase-like protein